MGLFDRVSRVIRSNLNALVSSAEDPEKILEQTVNDMQEDQVQLRQAVAQAIAAQKRLEQQYNQAQTQSNEWYRRAQLALQKGDENLAREALSRRQTFTETANSLKTQLDQSTTQVDTLKRQMTGLESKIAEAKTKKDMLTARARAAKANEQINQAMGRVDTTSAFAAFERMEDKVMEIEARSSAYAELASDNLDSQFAALESGGDLDAELQLLKAQMDNPSLPAGAANPASLPAGEPTATRPDSAVVDAELEELRNQIDNA
ncbi:PspA/IM30 family protein [Synechococcales cyanobacterium C]|uniref:PspA/IM30 family protein n=1 Tax=Petrachloros mirabilis ULC683 TaxID=2781853 RepID=A0A8K2A781_9CYAN|nr:PspA/IM30 family protein [Petrachloros mirabilis]NCJ05720.1 PspA/IM30 family protein [Petrachloros mirabilis ULC683]